MRLLRRGTSALSVALLVASPLTVGGSPRSPGGHPQDLRAVSALSATNAWAVGSVPTGVGENTDTLILHWNGKTWSKEKSPNGSNVGNSLEGVSALSRTNAWAVGDYFKNSGNRTLILHWNGTSWSKVKSPNPSATGDFLFDVSADSATDAWAVGNFSASSGSRTLILHWNGHVWSKVNSPNPSTTSNELTGVSAVSADDAWTVGSYFSGSSSHTLILHWDGTTWSKVKSPNPATGTSPFNILTAVSARSATDAWAVGSYSTSSGNDTLILHWDGTSWSKVKSPNPGTGSFPYNGLNGVVDRTSSDVWAVGSYSTKSSGFDLILHWNGRAWSRMKSPHQGSSSGIDSLTGVTASTAKFALAVGFFCPCGGGSVAGGIRLHWNGSAWVKT